MNISVVIPLYNKEQYIYRAIVSVINQITLADEIIVIDDGSTDQSETEVKKIICDRLIYIKKQNTGEGATRNFGVNIAKNELVAFLDADDEWKPDFLSEIERLYNNFPDCGMYATSYDIVDFGKTQSAPDTKLLPPGPWIGIIPNLFELMQHCSPFFPSSVAIPKKVLHQTSGFPEGVRQGADRMLWTKIGLNYPIAYSPQKKVIYHRDANGRASDFYEVESFTANLIQNLIEQQQVPDNLLPEVINFWTALRIQKASHRINAGDKQLARDLLKSIGFSKKYQMKVIKWFVISYFPIWFINFVRKFNKEEKNN
jgi:glycosyltransferase involved in cell wall biosynthesis